jgi:hypothetical protein
MHSFTCPASPTSKVARITLFLVVSTHSPCVVASMSLGVISLSAGAKMLSSGSPEIAHLTFRAFAMSSLTTTWSDQLLRWPPALNWFIKYVKPVRCISAAVTVIGTCKASHISNNKLGLICLFLCWYWCRRSTLFPLMSFARRDFYE